MDYNLILELDNLTLDDCIQLNYRNIFVVINDGRIVNLKNENE